ncbi:MAG: hypothetical protein WC756_06735 [Taibaiella sp.]|jgi:hypothetical protein
MSDQLKTEYWVFDLDEISGMGRTEIKFYKVSSYKQFDNEEDAKIWIQAEGKRGRYTILPVYTNP